MSLYGTYDDQNIFAKILRGEMPAVKVFEDDVALAFMDIFPIGRGHTLVIPKNSTARNFLTLADEQVCPYMLRVQRVAKAVAQALVPDGVSILQFNGAPAGQTIFHLHFHIVPRWEGVAMGAHGATPRAEIAELEALAARIRAAF
ncbi:MAG: HIT family protein [Hyphomonadaceae bacterium]